MVVRMFHLQMMAPVALSRGLVRQNTFLSGASLAKCSTKQARRANLSAQAKVSMRSATAWLTTQSVVHRNPQFLFCSLYDVVMRHLSPVTLHTVFYTAARWFSNIQHRLRKRVQLASLGCGHIC